MFEGDYTNTSISKAQKNVAMLMSTDKMYPMVSSVC